MIHKSFLPYLPFVKELMRQYRVKTAFVFGSVLTEGFRSDSDVDLLINFMDYSNPLAVGQSIWDLEDALERLTSRKIDLITEHSLKNPYFIEELNNKKQLIYESQT